MAKVYDGGSDSDDDVSVLRLFTTLAQICINENELRPQPPIYTPFAKIYRVLI